MLYGLGETFIHPEIEKILKFLKNCGEILSITNGANEKIITLGKLVDYLGFSVETFENINSSFRPISPKEILEKAEYLRKYTNVFLSIVVCKNNLFELPKLIKWAGERGINVFVSHIFPLTKELANQTLFVEISEPVFKKSKTIFKDIKEIEKLYSLISSYKKPAIELYKSIQKELGDFYLNLKGLILAWKKEDLLKKTQEVFYQCREISKKYNIVLELPKIFSNEKQRTCPYSNGIYIRADFKVAPCLFLSYPYPIFLNFAEKRIKEFICSVNQVENNKDFLEFQEKKENIVHYFPWCGDCQLIESCWFLEEGMDCYTNFPSCSLCLFSTGIINCIV